MSTATATPTQPPRIATKATPCRSATPATARSGRIPLCGSVPSANSFDVLAVFIHISATRSYGRSAERCQAHSRWSVLQRGTPIVADDPTAWRIEAMRKQIVPSALTIPLLAIPGIKAEPGTCNSCGDEMSGEPAMGVGRCGPCVAAARELSDEAFKQALSIIEGGLHRRPKGEPKKSDRL